MLRCRSAQEDAAAPTTLPQLPPTPRNRQVPPKQIPPPRLTPTPVTLSPEDRFRLRRRSSAEARGLDQAAATAARSAQTARRALWSHSTMGRCGVSRIAPRSTIRLTEASPVRIDQAKAAPGQLHSVAPNGRSSKVSRIHADRLPFVEWPGARPRHCTRLRRTVARRCDRRPRSTHRRARGLCGPCFAGRGV